MKSEISWPGMFVIGNMENLYFVEGKIETSTPSQGCICISKHRKLDLDSPPSLQLGETNKGAKSSVLTTEHSGSVITEQWHCAD